MKAAARSRADEPARLILAVARTGDRNAFAMLFEHFAPRVKSYMLRLGAAPEAAEELAQEALLTVWRKAALFDPARAGASTWIFAIARNLRIDAIRRERRPKIEDDPTDEPAPEPAADTVVAAAERDMRLREAMAALPGDQAEVVRQSFFQDKAHSEIARDLDLPLGTVKSRLRLALARLRGLVGDLA
jgi:RNA polymerase sigma-70 factor (ECF subfamily)